MRSKQEMQVEPLGIVIDRERGERDLSIIINGSTLAD
jgi:hypothetical protein